MTTKVESAASYNIIGLRTGSPSRNVRYICASNKEQTVSYFVQSPDSTLDSSFRLVTMNAHELI